MKRREFIIGATSSAGILLLDAARAQTPCPPNLDGAASPSPCPSPGAADWDTRTSGQGVVWFHDFRNKAEVDNFRWSGGYRGGNDPLGKGSPNGSNTRWLQGQGPNGGNCLEILRPAGSSDIASHWWRPFSPIVGEGNGRGVDDPGADGTLPAQNYASTDGGSEISNWRTAATRPGFYGNADYHSGNTFDGSDLYLQMRVKMDPRRTQSGNSSVGKLLYLTITDFSLSSQEIVTYSGAFATAGGPNYHRMYATEFTPMEDLDSLGRPGIQVGSDLASYPNVYCQINSQPGNCWAYSGGWDTLMYHIAPGHNGSRDTRMEVWAAHEGEATYTKIWDLFYPANFELVNGWNALILSTYQNNQSNTEFWHRFSEVIFSKEFIPCPLA